MNIDRLFVKIKIELNRQNNELRVSNIFNEEEKNVLRSIQTPSTIKKSHDLLASLLINSLLPNSEENTTKQTEPIGDFERKKRLELLFDLQTYVKENPTSKDAEQIKSLLNDASKKNPSTYELKENQIIKTNHLTNNDLFTTHYIYQEDAITKYLYNLDNSWTNERKSVLAKALRKGYDISPLIETTYSKGQLQELFYGLEQGIDITPMQKTSLKYNEMKAMREAIVKGKDFSCYANPNKKRLYLDMDGTLAIFQPVDTLEKLYEKGFFEKMKPQQSVVDAIKLIIKEHPEIEVNILSAVLTDSQYALQEKKQWLDKYLPEIPPENRIFTTCGEDKKNFIIGGVRPNDFLLDDYTHNLTLWQPPAKGIKILNGINATLGTWKDNQLDYTKSPQSLAEDITAIINNDITIKDMPPQKRPQSSFSLSKHTDGIER